MTAYDGAADLRGGEGIGAICWSPSLFMPMKRISSFGAVFMAFLSAAVASERNGSA